MDPLEGETTSKVQEYQSSKWTNSQEGKSYDKSTEWTDPLEGETSPKVQESQSLKWADPLECKIFDKSTEWMDPLEGETSPKVEESQPSKWTDLQEGKICDKSGKVCTGYKVQPTKGLNLLKESECRASVQIVLCNFSL